MFKKLPFLLLVCLVHSAGAADGKPEPQKFDDWAKVCEKDAENKESCYIFQTVMRKETNELLMNVRVGYAKKSGDKPLMILTLPNGVLLPAGAAFMIDGVEPVKLQYLTCTNVGCITMASPLPAAMIDGMKKKTQAAVRIANTDQKVVGLPVSLKGFTRGFGSLVPPK